MADQVWLDYSLARPTDAQLKAANTFGVCRYLSVVNELTTKKIIWQAEYDHLLNLGIAIHLNYEWYEGRMSGDPSIGLTPNEAGQIDGSTALEQAKTLGYPRGLPVTFSDDTVGTALADIKNYLNGAKAGLSGYYRIGYYGPVDKLDAVLTSGHAVFGWQPTAWSGGRVSKLAHLFQYFGGAPIPQTDLNKVLREPPFAWYVGGDMPLTDADVVKIWAHLIPSVIDPTKSYSAQFMLASTNKDANDAEKAAKAIVVPTADQIAAAVVAALPENPGGGATPAEVTKAVTDVINATRTVSP